MKRLRVALVLVGLLAAKTTLAQPPARPQRPPDPRTAGPGRPATAKSPAEALLDRAIAADDAGRHAARHLRGGLKAKMGDCKGAKYQQAVPVLIQATKENPSDPRGFAYLAAAYFKLSVTREFEAARDRAVALDPGIMRTVP